MAKTHTNYKPIPFYFVNDTLNREEIDEQMRLMKQSGVSGFFLHARCGLAEKGYANEQWFKDVDYLIQKATENNLETWLYDEDAYPSGNAGGLISMEHPEYVAQELVVKKLNIENGRCREVLGFCKPLRAYGVRQENGKTVTVDMTECFGVAREDWFCKTAAYTYVPGTPLNFQKRSAAYNPQLIFYAENVPENTEIYVATAARCYRANKFGSLVDTLNKDCVDLFKKYSYEKYYDKLSTSSLSAVKGIFTDEPVTGGLPPWTDKLEQVFFEKKGYKLEDNYHLIFFGTDEFSSILRRDYYQVVGEMFKQNYLDNIHDFCEQKGIKLVGHFEAEEIPYWQAIKAFSVYQCCWTLDYSGFDSLQSFVGGRENYTIFFGAKLASSVSVQKGSDRTICEMFAVNPFNFDVDGMKKVMGMALISGADTSVPHAFYYGFSGYRKYDAGKSFFFQDPKFSEFGEFSRFADECGSLIKKGESVSDTLLVYPDWEFIDYSFQEDGASKQLEFVNGGKYDKFFNKFMSVFTALMDNHIEFDLTDCEYISKNFYGGNARVGVKEYKNIVYISSGSPVMKEIKQKLQKTNANFYDWSNGVNGLDKLLSSSENTCLKTVKGDHREVNTLVKRSAQAQYTFMYNSSAKNNVVKIDVNKKTYLFEGNNGKYYKLIPTDKQAIISLQGYGFYALITTDQEILTDGDYVPNEYKDKTYESELNPDWVYRPNANVKVYIDKYDVKVDNGVLRKEYESVPASLLREIVGADMRARTKEDSRPVYDGSVIKTDYPVNAVYRAQFKGNGATQMLFEQSTFNGEYKLILNGKEIDKSKIEKTRVYDFRNLKLDVEELMNSENNVLEIVFTSAGENDGIISEIYFI